MAMAWSPDATTLWSRSNSNPESGGAGTDSCHFHFHQYFTMSTDIFTIICVYHKERVNEEEGRGARPNMWMEWLLHLAPAVMSLAFFWPGLICLHSHNHTSFRRLFPETISCSPDDHCSEALLWLLTNRILAWTPSSLFSLSSAEYSVMMTPRNRLS